MDQLKEYLGSVDEIKREDKNYTFALYQKIQYLTNVYERHPNEEKYCGNCNASIAFLFESQASCQALKPVLSEFLQRFNISIWNVFLCFNGETSLAFHALNSVAPKIIYSFTDGGQTQIPSCFLRLEHTKFVKIPPATIGSEEAEQELLRMNLYKELEIKA